MVVLGLVDRVTRRMRAAGRVGRTVTLRLRFDDFSRAAAPIIQAQGLTLVGMSVGNLEDAGAVQLPLPFDHADGVALEAALDRVRERFGSAAITRAVQLGRREALTVPLLPD